MSLQKSVDNQPPSLAPEIHQLEKLLCAKDDFLRLTVHEFRGPVGRIAGYLSMISGGDFGEISGPMREAIGQTESDIEQLNLFLEILTSAAQIEDHSDILKRSALKVSELVEKAIGMVKAAASNKHIRIEREGIGREVEIEAASRHLQVAVANLLSNAVKYSPESSTITISVSHSDTAVDITVKDQGPGIDPSYADLVFTKYWRGNLSTTGLGLGLYLVHQIVELHGGSVTVTSETAKGSSFSIHLPCRLNEQVSSPS